MVPFLYLSEDTDGLAQTLVSVQTVMNFHALEISLPLDDQPPQYQFKPGSFLARFIGHEGPRSSG